MDENAAPAATVRRLDTADLPAYKSLRDTALTEHPEAFTSDPSPERTAESYRGRLGLSRPQGGEFTLGAWRNGTLLGAISCERDERPKAHHIGHVIGMMVRSDAHGQGIGRALLIACIEEARASDGLVLLTLSVTAGNRSAVHLYERAGFVRYGSLPRAIRVEGVYHAKDLMVLTL